MLTVGQIVRARREQRGLTLAALAEAIGNTKGYLSMIENHKVPNPPSATVLAELEKALGITDGELQRAAAWQNTPAPVRIELERVADAAQRGKELAKLLQNVGEKRSDGTKSLDKAFKSGELDKLIQGLLDTGEKKKGKGKGKSERPAASIDSFVPLRYQVPVINRVAAGYPRDFTDLDAFAARVVGDSMMPEYREGDIVVFSPAAKVTDGCDCFVRLEPDHESTFKRIFMEKEPGQIRLQPLNSSYPPRVLDREQVAGMYRAVWRFTPLG
jgi:SOS-response transcriptional repressor LexA